MLNSQLLLMHNPTQVANSADKSQQAGTLNVSKSPNIFSSNPCKGASKAREGWGKKRLSVT